MAEYLKIKHEKNEFPRHMNKRCEIEYQLISFPPQKHDGALSWSDHKTTEQLYRVEQFRQPY